MVADLIRNINDPEHPLSLEELNVVRLGLRNALQLSSINHKF